MELPNWPAKRGKASGVAIARERFYVTTPEEFGAVPNSESHDCAEAITKAIDTAVTEGKAAGQNYAEVWLAAGTYFATRPTQKNPTTKGNAQIPLPVYPITDPGFTLRIRGAGSAPIRSFGQESLELQGSVIRSTLIGQSFDGTFGAPSVLAGPTPDGEESKSAPSAYTHLHLILDGVSVELPKNPSLAGFDLRRVLEVEVADASVMVHATPEELNVSRPANELGMGLRLPEDQNGNNVQVDNYATEGTYFGIELTNHLVARRILCVYTHAGAYIGSGFGAFSQGAVIDYLSIVAANEGIHCALSSEADRFPLVVPLLQFEEIAGSHVVDASNALVGYLGFVEGQSGAAPVLTGASHIVVDNLNNRRAAAIASPGETTASLKAAVDAIRTVLKERGMTG